MTEPIREKFSEASTIGSTKRVPSSTNGALFVELRGHTALVNLTATNLSQVLVTSLQESCWKGVISTVTINHVNTKITQEKIPRR